MYIWYLLEKVCANFPVSLLNKYKAPFSDPEAIYLPSGLFFFLKKKKSNNNEVIFFKKELVNWIII